MKFQVGLLDKSKVIEKMLSHCLHYFVVDLRFFTDWEQAFFYTKKNPKFDILFVDWDMSYNSKRMIDLAQEQLHSIPTVLMHRKDEISKLKNSAHSTAHHKALEHKQDELHKLIHFPHRVEKPLNPKHVREIFRKLIPEITEQTPHPFLKYPKSYDSKSVQPTQQSVQPTQQSVQPTQQSMQPTQQSMQPTQQSMQPTQQSMQPTQQSVQPTQQSMQPTQPSQTHLNPTQPHSQKTNATPSLSNQNLAQQNQKTREETLQPLSSENITQATQTSIQIKNQSPAPSSIPQDPSTAPQTHSHISQKIDKSTLVLSETTKNDFAPLPFKSSGSKKEDSATKARLTEEQLLQVLNKYKDSLEFTKIMETTLTNYAKEAVQSFLDPQQAKNVMKESMQDFQGANQFKQQVETEVKNQIKLHLEPYLKKELALQIKSVLQEEIQKILSE